MIRLSIVTVILGFTSFSYAQTDPLPSAESVLDRYVEVTGGKAAYEKRKNEIATGTVEFKAQGLKGTVIRYSAAPAQEYLITEIEGVGKLESGLNNGVAWDKNAMLGARLKTGVEGAEALRAATFNAPLHWRELYTKVEVAGSETIDSEPCYKIVLTPKQGNPETMYFQKKSGFAVKTAMITVSPMGETPAEMFESDYKSLGGIMTPTKLTTKVSQLEFTITFDDVKINQALPKDRFEPPAEVKALIAKEKK